jgi:iron complex outermembrane recepter protein
LRKYFENDGVTISTMLEQPSFFTGRAFIQNLRGGVDYSMNQKTSAGITLTGLLLDRKGNTNNTASWLNANSTIDSLIKTNSSNTTNWRNGGINFNLRHAFTTTKELAIDVDRIGYEIKGWQFFENNRISPTTYTEQTKADLPSEIQILSAKADYTQQIKKWKLEAGAKTSHITTDNLAEYEYLDGLTWRDDLGKSNHFLYTENIHALYANTETKTKKWSLQGGLRYELTNYDANQLGNALVKDSSFSRSYASFFPSAFVSYEVDSSNSFSISAGRRIDRPAFQKLNPFVFIINKYTYQTGNPFFRPQYTWNLELSHLYKQVLITSLSYSLTNDYISQLFPIDANGIVIYTEGNLKRLQTYGASVSAQLAPAKWWSLSSQLVLTHKKMEGFIGKDYSADITQVHFNLNNQFRFNKGWAGEVSGFYTSKSQNDIQEVLDPAGQLSIGISKTVLKNKGTIKLAARDIFYTQWMKGLTSFTLANEYFKLTRDTRVFNISFNYRFGKAYKTVRRSQGAAGEEIQRVGNG